MGAQPFGPPTIKMKSNPTHRNMVCFMCGTQMVCLVLARCNPYVTGFSFWDQADYPHQRIINILALRLLNGNVWTIPTWCGLVGIGVSNLRSCSPISVPAPYSMGRGTTIMTTISFWLQDPPCDTEFVLVSRHSSPLGEQETLKIK